MKGKCGWTGQGSVNKKPPRRAAVEVGGIENMEYTVNFTWDSEAAVWIATSEDIPSLVLESGSFDALLERVRFAAPELLALNGDKVSPFTLTVQSERRERIAM